MEEALCALEWTDGVVELTEQESADAKAIIGCKHASAATLAGIKRLVAGIIDKSSSVVGVLTGNLLKDPTYTIGYHTGGLKLKPDASSARLRPTLPTNRPEPDEEPHDDGDRSHA